MEAAAFAREELAVDSLLDQGVAKGERAGRLVVDRHHVALDCLARVGLDRKAGDAEDIGKQHGNGGLCGDRDRVDETAGSVVERGEPAEEHGTQPG